MVRIGIFLFVYLSFVIQVSAQDISRGYKMSSRIDNNSLPNQNEQIILRQADYHFSMGDLEEALLTLDEGFSLNPNSLQILLERALLKKRMGMDTEAEQDIARAQVINPHVANLFGYNGADKMMYVLSSNPIAAITDLTSYQRLAYYYEAMDEEYESSAAKSVIMESLEELIMQIENEEYELATVTAKKTIIDYPESAIAQDLYGVLLLKNEDYKTAKVAFEKATFLNPNFAIAWYNLGRTEKYLGEYSLAQEHLNKAIELQVDLTKAYFDRALLSKKNGEPEQAIKDYTSIINLKGNNYPEAYLNRALTRKMLGDFQGALSDIDYIINNQTIETAEPYFNRGNLHMIFGLTNDAIADYTKVLELDADNAEAYYNRGLAFLLVHDNSASCADLDKSRELGFQAANEMLNYFCTN